MHSIQFYQSLRLPLVIAHPLHALVEERQALVPVRHEAPLLYEPDEHLGAHHHREELDVGLVPALEEVAQLEEGLGISGAHRGGLGDGQEVRAVALQSQDHEFEECFLYLQLLRQLCIKSRF